VQCGDDVVDVAIDGACGECGDWWAGETEGWLFGEGINDTYLCLFE